MLSATLFGLSSLVAIADVRVGDDGHVGRVEVECTGPCQAEPLGDQSFLILQATGDFQADVTRQSQFVHKIEMRTTRRGATLTVVTNGVPRAVTAAACRAKTLCFDFDLAPAPLPKLVERSSIDDIEQGIAQLMTKTGIADPSPVRIAEASKDGQGCTMAERTLAEDPWNLFAYRTVAVCRARAGDPKEAARLIARLEHFSHDYSAQPQKQLASLKRRSPLR